MHTFATSGCFRLCVFLFVAALCAGCPRTDSALTGALRYLETTQTTREDEARGVSGRTADFEGNWPQFFHFRAIPDYRIREVSPFVVAFIHHALTLIRESNSDVLGLTPAQLDSARDMRLKAVAFMKRFESGEGEPDARTFGFWPHDQDPLSPVS